MTAAGTIRMGLERLLHAQITRVQRGHFHAREQRGASVDNVEILSDRTFRAACARALRYTELDTPRLANLWQLARISNPAGPMLEVGVYRGGSAMVLADACPGRPLIVADTFRGFGSSYTGDIRDSIFTADQYDRNNRIETEARVRTRAPHCVVLEGSFPASDVTCRAAGATFAHLDLDLYESTAGTLTYLRERMGAGPMIVLDDFRRSAKGVDDAVSEFLRADHAWRAFPLYPGQGLLVRRDTAGV